MVFLSYYLHQTIFIGRCISRWCSLRWRRRGIFWGRTVADCLLFIFGGWSICFLLCCCPLFSFFASGWAVLLFSLDSSWRSCSFLFYRFVSVLKYRHRSVGTFSCSIFPLFCSRSRHVWIFISGLSFLFIYHPTSTFFGFRPWVGWRWGSYCRGSCCCWSSCCWRRCWSLGYWTRFWCSTAMRVTYNLNFSFWSVLSTNLAVLRCLCSVCACWGTVWRVCSWIFSRVGFLWSSFCPIRSGTRRWVVWRHLRTVVFWTCWWNRCRSQHLRCWCGGRRIVRLFRWWWAGGWLRVGRFLFFIVFIFNLGIARFWVCFRSCWLRWCGHSRWW